MPDNWQDIATGEYKDQRGRVWFCVVRDRNVVCTEATSWTCADHATFRRWGWQPLPSPPTDKEPS